MLSVGDWRGAIVGIAALAVSGAGCAGGGDSNENKQPILVGSAGSPGAGTGSSAGAPGAAGSAPSAGRSGAAGANVTGGAGRGTPGGTAGMGTGGMTAGASAAGTSGEAGAAAGTSGGAGTVAPPLDGPAPTLPPIMGECPAFNNGTTIMVAGHRGVAISAGEKGKGGPLLFYWHGTGGSAMEAQRTLPASVRTEILSSGGIIAAFNGQQSSGTEGDCSGTAAHNMADFKAADQIAACAVRDHGIDPRRIYATGCSAGGLQSGCMAQLRSSYMAAVAPNSGGVVFPQRWQDEHSPAVFTMHGGSSDVVIVTFSETSRTFDMSAKDHGSFVVNCNHGGGHCRAPADLQTAAWQFMKDHPWGFTTSPWATAFPAGVPDYCKIF